MANNQHVKKIHGKWAVIGQGNEKPTSLHPTQDEAIEAARQIAIRQRSEVVIHRATGRIRHKNSYRKSR